ncbi:hypothetical protein BD779DRAFT_1626850 [Infundibulicybe gibba]|nr:hypothetical protein BD779DRAFT_1626850 [Infundibulicybe gibba]
MEKASSTFAALYAGKLPSHQQTIQLIDYINSSVIPTITPDGRDGLSIRGRVLARDVRDILDAYKQLSIAKNNDDTLQEAIYNLTQSESVDVDIDTKAATSDLQTVQHTLRTLLATFFGGISTEGSFLLTDFASFLRLSLADTAELLESQAAQVKDGLRSVESEVQDGKRDALGRDKKALELRNADLKEGFKQGMDTVRDLGVSAIGTGQNISASAKDKKHQTEAKLSHTFDKICDRAQSDPEYRSALTDLFSLLRRRLNQATSPPPKSQFTLSSFLHDPTSEKHIQAAFDHLHDLLIRFTSQDALGALLDSARDCAYAILTNDDLKAFFDQFLTYLEKILGDKDYTRTSDAAKATRKELRAKWRTIKEEAGAEIGAQFDRLKEAMAQVADDVDSDPDLLRLRTALNQFSLDIENAGEEAGVKAKGGMQALMDRAMWFWQDLFSVYLPRLAQTIKDVPIPRTEYQDDTLELVLENLTIASLSLQPAHTYVRHITDIDIVTPPPNSTTPTAIKSGTLTHIKLQAVQLSLPPLSFYCSQKDASALTPSTLTGRLALELPPHGLALDLRLRHTPETSTPTSPSITSGHFTRLESLSVTLADDMHVTLSDTSHPVLVSLFEPLIKSHLKAQVENVLAGLLSTLITSVDAALWDVARRGEVFKDAGVPRGAAVLGGVWSALGATRAGGVQLDMRRGGIVLGGENGKMSIGVEPQILGGEKHGPEGAGSKDLEEVLGVDAGDVKNVKERSVNGAKEVAKDAGEALGRAVQEGKREAQGFWDTVKEKENAERKREGWRSDAFDV